MEKEDVIASPEKEFTAAFAESTDRNAQKAKSYQF
jgi:hypothetical protein